MELSPKYLKYYEDCVFLCLLQVEGVSLLLGPLLENTRRLCVCMQSAIWRAGLQQNPDAELFGNTVLRYQRP